MKVPKAAWWASVMATRCCRPIRVTPPPPVLVLTQVLATASEGPLLNLNIRIRVTCHIGKRIWRGCGEVLAVELSHQGSTFRYLIFLTGRHTQLSLNCSCDSAWTKEGTLMYYLLWNVHLGPDFSFVVWICNANLRFSNRAAAFVKRRFPSQFHIEHDQGIERNPSAEAGDDLSARSY